MKSKRSFLIAVVVVLLLISSIVLAACNTDPVKSIVSIEKTGTQGLVDTYTITYSDGTTTTFTITNGKDGENGKNGTDGKEGEDGVVESEIRLVNGEFYLGDLRLGLGLDRCVETTFDQKGETLNGSLDMNVLLFGFFSKIKYSIYRTGATIGDETFYDYLVQETELTSPSISINLDAGYHGNYVLYVKLYGDSETLLYTAERAIDFKASHYNINYLNATLPVLLATTQLYTEEQKGVTYMGLDRRATYNWYELPENTYAFPNTVVTDGTTKLALFNQNGEEKTTVYGNQSVGTWGGIAQVGNPNHVIHTRKWIKDLYEMDNTSTFTFGCVDNSVNSSIIFSYGNNIPSSHFNIKIFTDGTATTSYLNSKNMNDYATWQSVRSRYENYIKSIANDATINDAFANKNFAYVMCTDSNVQYIVNCKPGMLNSVRTKASANADKLASIYEENVTQLTVSEAFEKVKAAGKINDLEYLLRTRWIDNGGEEGSASQYFDNANGKKNLMILGTSPGGEAGNEVNATFMELMAFVVRKYGSEYNIMYKGHPNYPLSKFENGTERQRFFTENGIIVLPNATPAETYMYLYNEVYVGGYYSTTFTSSMVGQTICFFGSENAIKGQASIATMFDTSADDYMGVFENSVFLDKSYIDAN